LSDDTTVGFQGCADTNNIRPGFGQGNGHGFADASFATGHQCRLAIQLKLIENTHLSSPNPDLPEAELQTDRSLNHEGQEEHEEKV
jgi:hypothetical protein